MIFRYLFPNIMAYAEGDFSFVEDGHERMMLKSMYDAVTITENWAKLRDAPTQGSFMFPKDPVVIKMTSELEKADEFKGHSGSSFGWTIRNIELIAKSGWAAFCKNYIKHQLETKIEKARNWRDEALLIYRAVWRRSSKLTNPAEKEYYEEITQREKCHVDMANESLWALEAKLEA
jgi:hypothetical protein